MNAKNNRQNHDFQIAAFLAGSCHTPDGAYALLCDLREDRATALKVSRADDLRNDAKRVRAQRGIESEDDAVRLDAQADLAEIEAFAELREKVIAAAVAEIATLDRYIEQVQPHRKFAHLPDSQAHEACQHDEWRAELMCRAENQLAAEGRISAELLGTLRLHPAFATDLLPALNEMISGVSPFTQRLVRQPLLQIDRAQAGEKP